MRAVLAEGLPSLGLDASAAPQLEQFARMLLERNQVMNLTAITEPKDVAALPVLSELCLPLVKVGGRFLAMKSSHAEEETARAEQAIRLLGGRIAWVKDYRIPATDVTHRLLCIEKTAHTPKKYPRRFAQMKKSPL